MPIPLPSGINDPILDVSAGEGMYDATSGGSAVTTTGGLVARWEDSSGTGNHLTQSTSGARPRYDADRNLVCFQEGAVNWMSRSLSANRNSVSTFLIAEIAPLRRGYSGSGYSGALGLQYALSLHPAAYLSIDGLDTGGQGNPGCLTLYDGSFVKSNLAPPSSLSLIGLSGGAAGYKFYVGGDVATTGTASSSSITDFFLGYSGAGTGLRASVKRALVFNRQVTDAQYADLWKWAQLKLGCVDNSTAPINVLSDGDSISSAVGQTLNRDWFARLTKWMPNLSRYNTSEASITVATLTTNSARVDAQIKPNAKNILITGAVSNDIALDGVNGATAFSRRETYCTARRSAGWDVIIIIGMCPRNGVETARQALTTLERAAFPVATNYPYITAADPATTWADYYVDIPSHPNIGQSGQNTDTTYYAADAIHLADNGHQVLADIIKPLFRHLATVGPTAATERSTPFATTFPTTFSPR